MWSKHHWYQSEDPCCTQGSLEQVLSEQQGEVNSKKTPQTNLQWFSAKSDHGKFSERAYPGSADKQQDGRATQYLSIYSRLINEYLIWLEATAAELPLRCI